ncbi:MAG: response regulator [Leptolyngbyaceae cyanobacterium bins.302]|nr:response regulator [Leptolyngbyaceae cyanobacterium bins.302]
MEDSIKGTSIICSDEVRVLIIEDEYVIAANLQEMVEALGYEVMGIAASVEDALEKIADCLPSLVLMDIRLQGQLDGIEAACFLWDNLQIPIIYITGHSDRHTLKRMEMTFSLGYLPKPVKSSELKATIASALNFLSENKQHSEQPDDR